MKSNFKMPQPENKKCNKKVLSSTEYSGEGWKWCKKRYSNRVVGPIRGGGCLEKLNSPFLS